MTNEIYLQLKDSLAHRDKGESTTTELLAWIRMLNETTVCEVKPQALSESSFWFYDDYAGEIINRKRSFFSIKGVRLFLNNKFVGEQPMIFQPEIGYLGIICRKVGGVLQLLMQAKIEPGNVNTVQLSPTIQATKSNFTRAHGGKLPAYFDYFEHADRHTVIYDQIQSEQGSRFEAKRNRNIIIIVDEDVPVLPNFKWMTLGQLKALMMIPNLVNMDTRTVLAGLPIMDECDVNPAETLIPLEYALNNYKMFTDRRKLVVPLNQLVDWEVDDYGVRCSKPADFEVAFYDIEIHGREVQNWNQPLLRALGAAMFGLPTRLHEGRRQYLVKISPEMGMIDYAEVGPAIQRESSQSVNKDDAVEKLFDEKLRAGKDIIIDVVLSEEGGRFYHEQNRNVIMEFKDGELDMLPEGYFWLDVSALNTILSRPGMCNIQLRNMVSLIQ